MSDLRPKNTGVIMSTPSQPLLSQAKVEVPEVRYKSDLELHDRFQQFSSELLKLSVAGIGAFGLFLGLLGDKNTSPTISDAMRSPEFYWLSAGCLAFLGISAACALIHRFLASDGMFFHLRAIKLLIMVEQQAARPEYPVAWKEGEVRAAVQNDEATRTVKFMRSEHYLVVSAVSLVAGAVFLAAAFLNVLGR